MTPTTTEGRAMAMVTSDQVAAALLPWAGAVRRRLTRKQCSRCQVPGAEE
jgi:hypothetical protein